MLCFTSKTLLLFLSLSFFISFGFGNSDNLQTTGEGGDQREHGGVVVTWGTRRSLAEEKIPRNAPLTILSRERTRRKDPRDGFKRYTGGWNISNEHYWASVNYTATPFLVIAFVWFKIFAISLCLTCICNFCRPKEPYGYSRRAYALSPIFLVFFTLAAIVGFIVLFSGQGKFQGSSTDALNHVVSQANTTAAKLRNVSYNLSAAKRIGVDAVFLPEDVQKKIDNIVTEIDASAATLSDRTKKNLKTIKDSLNTMRILLINLVAAMIFLALLGILFSILGKQVGVHILVIVGWILVTLAFILCGAFVVLHNAVGDACVAMDEWVQNPKPHTAFDDILPCVDNATAQEAALRTKDATFQLVTVVNHVITNASNVDNQSDRPVPLLCNPFHSNLIDRHCISGEVPLQNATQLHVQPLFPLLFGGEASPDSTQNLYVKHLTVGEPTICQCLNAEKCDCSKKTGEDAGLLANFGYAERTSLSSLRGSHQALKPASLIVRRSSHDPLSAAITRSITSCIANTPDFNSSHTILNQIGRTNTNFPGSQNDEFNSGTCATLILGSAPLLRQFYLFQRLFGMPNNFFGSLWPPHIRHGGYTFQLGQASASSNDNGFQNETRIDLWRQLLMESTLYMHRPPDSLLEGPTSFFVITASHGVNFIMNAGATYQRPLHFSIEMRDRYGAMWLDVDSMSYEELLALEDHIGYVSTGLSEEAAVTSLKRSNYFVFKEENAQKDFCSICQEDFVEEDELGTLDCGHGFHISCIKQWLGYKNVCPMCKSPGLSTKLPSFSHIQSQ